MVRTLSADALGTWANGVALGLRTIRKEPVLGLKRLALPVSYWRSVEFAYTRRQLQQKTGARILDVGSPKDLAALLAHHHRYEVIATDILPESVALSDRYAVAQGLAGQGPGRVHSEVQDGRALPYAQGSFDAAYSVSVLEHIPEEGDTVAIGELLRVVKPGGVVVITVPYDRRYRETFVDGSVYERQQKGSEPVFFERHYDRETLLSRLLSSPLAEVTDLSLWGEGRIRMEAVLTRLGPLRAPLSPLEAFFSSALLRPVPPEGAAHPMAAFVTLRRRAP